jgi:hypothetical protein
MFVDVKDLVDVLQRLAVMALPVADCGNTVVGGGSFGVVVAQRGQLDVQGSVEVLQRFKLPHNKAELVKRQHVCLSTPRILRHGHRRRRRDVPVVETSADGTVERGEAAGRSSSSAPIGTGRVIGMGASMTSSTVPMPRCCP